MTAIEKILAKASGAMRVVPGESLECNVDLVATMDLQGKLVLTTLENLGVTKLPDPEKMVIVLDHQSPANSVAYAEIHKGIRTLARSFGVKHLYDVGCGILHVVLPEEGFILPGELILMNESHTPTGGAIGAAVIGVGQTDAAVAIATGRIWLIVPETIRINFHGKLRPGAGAKDIALKLMSILGYEDKAVYRSIEIGGDIADIDMDGRFTITNFCSDMGAKSAFFETDVVTHEFLAGRARKEYIPVFSDVDCTYAEVYDIDLESIEPLLACPHTLDNIQSVATVAGVKIDQALLGTCTNGRLDDLKIAARIMEGRKVAPGVRFFITAASREIYRQALKAGYIEVFADAGATILGPGCGSCYGEHSGVLAAGEVAISTGNRNWRGRMGSTDAEIYLASPETVAISAIMGSITDPRQA